MEPFYEHNGIVVPIDQMNVDTDAIMPKDFIKRIERTGFGQYLFFHWKFDLEGREKSEFVLNQDVFRNGSILLARKNFGCGSSREHAPWGLQDYGFKVLIAPSFGDIFYSNCLKVGLLPVILAEKEVDQLFQLVERNQGTKLEVNLEETTIKHESGLTYHFKIDPYHQQLLLNGLDDIDLTNNHEQAIQALEKRHKVYYRF